MSTTSTPRMSTTTTPRSIKAKTSGLSLHYVRSVASVMLLLSVAGMALGWQSTWTAGFSASPSRRELLSQQAELAALVNTTAQAKSRSSWAMSDYDAWQPPHYSTHTCISQKFDDYWQMASCKFDNVCLNASTKEIEYYMDPHLPDNPVAYNQEGKAYHQFSPHLLNPAHALVASRMGWRPVVKRMGFPEEGPRVKWASSPQALLQALPVRFLYNFGHVMFDVLVPLFNMQHLFGVYTPDAQILILQNVGDTKKHMRKALARYVNSPDPDKSLLRLTWDHDALWPREYAAQELRGDGDGLVCFKTVLAGTGFLSRRMSRVDALPYRQAVVERLGLQEEPQDVPTITFLRKEGRRMIENSDEIYHLLRERFPAARVSMVDFGKWPNLTMEDQVKLMSDTSILISPCGGLATVLAFLRPSSTAIVMNYWHTLKNRSIHMEDNYYRNIEYLDIQYFPVTLDDYTGTRDRPACELVKDGPSRYDHRYPQSGALVNCNLRIQREGIQRLVHYVDNAMMRWAARTGHYEVLASITNQTQSE